jgi:hypothetical protein
MATNPWAKINENWRGENEYYTSRWLIGWKTSLVFRIRKDQFLRMGAGANQNRRSSRQQSQKLIIVDLAKSAAGSRHSNNRRD